MIYTNKYTNHTRMNMSELYVDALMFATLFYILSNTKMYEITSSIFPMLIKDRVLLHAIVYALVYVMIQKLTKRA